jgi:hypothetical protein
MSRSCLRAVQHTAFQQQSSDWFLWSVCGYKKSGTVNIIDTCLGRETAHFKVSISTGQNKITQKIADTHPCHRARFEPVIPQKL